MSASATAAVKSEINTKIVSAKENNESSSCCGRMWNYLKVNVPIAAKIAACAAMRFLSLVAAIAGTFGVYHGFLSLTNVSHTAFLLTIPAAFALGALASVISNAAIHALGWENYSRQIIGPMPILLMF